MSSFVTKNAGFLYLRFSLLFLFGIYALYIQSNNPNFLIKTLSIFWFFLGISALSVFVFKLIRKRPFLPYLIYAVIDVSISVLLYKNIEFISVYFSDFIGILAILLAFSLLLYRSNQNKNWLLNFFILLMVFFGVLMFFETLISEVLLSYIIAIFFVFSGLIGLLFTALTHFKGIKSKQDVK